MNQLKRLFQQNYKCINNKLWKKKQIKQYSDIPKNLNLDRECVISQTDNGIRVASEKMDTDIVCVSVFINCGSRQETEETSGSAHFLEHLNFKGSEKRSRVQLELEVENMGGQLNAYTSRENTSFTMNVFKENLEQAVEILSDMLIHSKYSQRSLENERDTIFRELIETQKESFETLIEISHQVSYPNHQIGRPILGEIRNIQNITRDMVIDYHHNFYRGDNILVVAAGNLNHNHLLDYVNKYFGKLQQKLPENLININQDKPLFNPTVAFIKADLLEVPPEGIHVGVFHEAPGWHNSDYYGFLLLQRLLSDKPQFELESQLYQKSNINSFQQMLNSYSLIENQRSAYTPYIDTALFGNYYYTDDCNQLQNILKLNREILQQYSSKLSEQELQRAKNRLYVELLQHETGDDIVQSIGNQVLYLGRRVYKQEIARRIQSYTVQDLQIITNKWLNNTNYSVTCWGNVKPLYALYNLEYS